MSEQQNRDALVRAAAQKYKLAGTMVDGRTVGETIPNAGSVQATLDDAAMLEGIREVRFLAFDQLGDLTFYSMAERERTEVLAAAILESGQVDPLIVVEDEQGPYVLEGGHRFDALRLLDAQAFPAVVVLDMAALIRHEVLTSAIEAKGVAPVVNRGLSEPTPDVW